MPEDVEPKLIASPSRCFYFGETSELYLLNPFKYEIKIFKDYSLFKTINREKRRYGGIVGGIKHYDESGRYAGYSVGYMAPPTIIKKENYTLIFHAEPSGVPNPETHEPMSFSVDIFKNYEFHRSQELDIKGFPLISDQEGNVYIVEYVNNVPVISKYSLNIE